jgi:predicted nucleic acid-binding protein
VTVAVDASVIVAALLATGPDGEWAEEILLSGELVCPHIMPAEVASALRRAEIAGEISADLASAAHSDLALLRVAYYDYAPLAQAAWRLRHSVNAYDAWYVALANELQVPLATLDRRLTRAPGVTCQFLTPGR